MRPFFQLPHDVLQAVRRYAELFRKAMGLQGLGTPAGACPVFPVFKVSAHARPITLEDVKRDEDLP